jgi:hypothetical protein
VYFYNDWTFLLIIPAMIFAMYAQNRVASTYARYAQRPAATGLTGAAVARGLLDRAGLGDVRIQLGQGRLTDHYDPRTRVLRLSGETHGRPSIAAVAIAAHEVGHALQHASGYAALAVRNGLVPIVNLTTTIAFPMFLIGLIMGQMGLVDLGILLFTGAVAFQLITLPVEFNASGRALALLEQGGYVQGREIDGVREMLNAAALTYLAAMAVTLSQLFRMMALRNRRR